MVVAGVQVVIEQVLVREGLPYEVSGDGRTYRLRFGAATVFIDFNDVAVTVHSPVLRGIEADSPGAAQVLNLLNELNRSYFFVKFVFRDGMLIARHDLLGEALDPRSLLNALYEVAGASNRVGGKLADLGH